MIYRRFPKGVRAGFVLAAVLLGGYILVRSLTPMQASVSVPGLDKIVHFCAYLVLGVLCLPAAPRMHPIIIWLGLAAFGAGIEFGQGAMGAGRTADFMDEIANISGAAFAILFWLSVSMLWHQIRAARDVRS